MISVRLFSVKHSLNMHEREILHENMPLVSPTTTGAKIAETTTTFMTKFHLAQAHLVNLVENWVFGLMTSGIGPMAPSWAVLEFSCGICHVSV